jgi:prepilin-type processing-associated H-X9-DG protein
MLGETKQKKAHVMDQLEAGYGGKSLALWDFAFARPQNSVARRGVFERSFDSNCSFCDGHFAGGSRFGFLFACFSASFF